MAEATHRHAMDYEATRKTAAPQKELCGKCLSISWSPKGFEHLKDIEGDIGWSLSHYETFGELETSCETGCPLCQTFFLLLSYDSVEFKKSDPLLWKLYVNDESNQWSLHCESSALSDGKNTWFMRENSWCPPKQAITTVKAFTPESLENDLKVIADESINPWIDACMRSGTHKNCPRSPSLQSDSYKMPTRLIDVGYDGDPSVRLINIADLSEKGTKAPYVILSYCWGSSNDSARTTSRNLGERLARIELKSLPKTIQDAIRVTQLMNIRYLWVDAVCIIQADKALSAQQQQQDAVARADWEKESTHMGSYYSNSFCCIAASNTEDSSEGFLTGRRVARYGYTKWLAPPDVFLPSPYSLREQSRSLLFGRGWCLQEWILSPRILHWTVNGLVWQCPHGFFWEGQDGFRDEVPQLFRDLPGDDEGRETNDCLLKIGINYGGAISQILYSEQEEALGETWAELVSEYSQMNLSVPSDRLAAIQGIASCLSERHGVEYFAGLFRSKCPYHLLWAIEDPRSSQGASQEFPTWSWASSKGKICFWENDKDDFISFMEDLEAFPSAQDEESLSRVAKAELCFTAPLIRFSVLGPEEGDPEDMPSEEDPDYGYEERVLTRFVLASEIPFWKGLTCITFVDDVSTSPSLKSRVHLLVLWSFPGEEVITYQGLVVQGVEEGAGRVEVKDYRSAYRRMGIFWIQKPRDCIQEPQDLNEWKTKVTLV